MAETQKKHTANAQAGGAPQPRTVSQTKKNTVTAPAREDTAKRREDTSAQAKERKRAGQGNPPPAPSEEQPTRAHRFSEQYMPYLWGAIGLFFTVCFLLDVIGQADTPNEHLMGVVGFWLCRSLFGLFGWAAFLLPVLFFSLAAFWRKYCREQLVGVQILMSLLFLLLLSAFIHVCACTFTSPGLGEITDITYLFEKGWQLEAGGVIGGYVGWVFFHGLKFAGSLVLLIVTMPLIIMFLVGVTPAYVYVRIRHKIKEVRAERRAAEERAAALAAEEAERRISARPTKAAEPEEAPAAQKPPRRIREASPEDLDAASVSDGEEPQPLESAPVAARRNRRSDISDPADGRTAAEARAIWLDPVTGEVLKEDGMEPGTAGAVPAETGEAPAKEKRGGLFAGLRRNDTPGTNETDIPADTEEETEPDDGLYTATPTPVTARRTKVEHIEITLEGEDPDTIDTIDTIDAETDDPESADTGSASDDAENDPFRDIPELMHTGSGNGGTSNVPSPTGDREIVVHVLRQETAAVTGTPDNPVDGLPDEQVTHASDAAASQAATATTEPEEAPYLFPPVDYLTKGSARYEADEEEIARNIRTLQDTLGYFHIRVKDISCSCGPTVTRYEVKPDVGVRVRSIANLVDDISLSLAKAGVRIEAPIPGKAAVGIEVPNDKAATVYLRNLIEAPEFQNHKSRIAACLGAEVSGRPVIFDINKMPHLLVAGTTGSGKSVCINCIIMSILYKAKPEEVKLILIDPKKVEFTMYRDLPHLYCPIVTDPKRAAGALYSAVAEMERRYELIEEVGVRNIAGYNEVTANDPGKPFLPQMIIIIDELADLMMTAKADVETAIARLAQKARAAGIHLILGTQRPSVDVITGLIKANIPSRIAFTVKSRVDSGTIIDTTGAEKLIGRGDMLYAPVGSTKPLRVQGAFVSDEEVERVVEFIKSHNGAAEYDEEFARQIDVEAAHCGNKKKGGDEMNIEDFDALGGGDEDPKFWEAVEVALNADKVSTSLLQRTLKLGYGRAAKIIDLMEERGIVGPADGNKPRKILITADRLAELRRGGN